MGGEVKKNWMWSAQRDDGSSSWGVRDPLTLVGKFVERGKGSGSFTRNKLK
jgi:hypothetical protein